jgi:hypothetical protein
LFLKQGGLTGNPQSQSLMTKGEHLSNTDVTCYSDKTLEGMITPQESVLRVTTLIQPTPVKTLKGHTGH